MILVGGGNVGVQLARRLLMVGNEVLLLEKDVPNAGRLARLLGEENVMLGDGCEMLVQRRAGFGRADVVIAVTGEDEDNLVVCQMAKYVWHVDRVLARVNDPDHEKLFLQVGIDNTVSATGIIYSLLEQQVMPDSLLPVGALARGNVEVVETKLTARSPVVGKRVRDLPMPGQTNIVWLLRHEHGQMVEGDTILEAGDTVVALVPRDGAEQLRTLFGNR
ncbi:MAG: TrkA family potassium uptake protein [Fimbriimonadaceae bacterium]|nr:TrkA family potassium uptake protein [Fimbriimonadaceae bacterium]